MIIVIIQFNKSMGLLAYSDDCTLLTENNQIKQINTSHSKETTKCDF